jgi:hypothetical protein
MNKLVDPIALLLEKASLSATAALSAPGINSRTKVAVPYELPLVPPAGSKLVHVTVGSTYGRPIPALFDPATRTTYPIAAD